MTISKSTKRWLVVLAISTAIALLLHSSGGTVGCVGAISAALACSAVLLLVVRGIVAAFRRIVRRTALRLAFSYFLIGAVPIPLLAALLFVVGYLLASQIVGARLRREIEAVLETALTSPTALPEVRVENDIVVTSDVDWLHPGDHAAWVETLTAPRPLIAGNRMWLAAPVDQDRGRIALLAFDDPKEEFLQKLADRTGYEVRTGTSREGQSDTSYQIQTGKGHENDWNRFARPRSAPPAGGDWLSAQWLVGLAVERPAAIVGTSSSDKRLIVFIARTSPRILFDQLFAQGAPEVGRVFWGIFAALSGALLLVYLIALAIAFFLIGSIARSVNRLTTAAQAVSRGDFSVRIQSKSRDQIGDLARSFDGMAASIQRLLVQTAEKERLEGEIAVARTIQQKLLPPPQAQVPGLELMAYFQPVAAIGGDYYDYFAMPDGRTAVAVGDVSGHGLPTGLLVAMAKAALTTQIESGLKGSELFTRLNDLIFRSTDSRNYMTLTLLAYDASSRKADLTNAGQLAPYRLSGADVSMLSLPSFPLGVSARSDFPTASYELGSGDRLLFLTDGFVEAASPEGEPFGFERMEALLKKEAAADAARLKEAILAAIALHTGGAATADDDRTMMIVTVRSTD